MPTSITRIPATYKGFELEWQTHFWYLPSIFRGLVLNVNYTRIFSEVEKQLYFNKKGDILPGSWPPRRENILVDSSRTARMPDQPAHIANVTLGYDYKNFSARLSYLYQADKVTFISTEPTLDNFSGSYSRWDFTLRQKLDWGVEVFANFNNLNGTPDRSFRGDALVNPTYIEYYGFTMDAGVRYRF
ncbi:MAG: TonB-dependent receptor [Actinobacteria bacterium]|nr:TonB-dependent receptor [Actinomycetota bacterium]